MEENKNLTIFSDPDSIDRIILTRLEQFSIKGGKSNNSKVKWTAEELSLRDSVIIDYITVQGLSREQTAQQIMSRWNIHIFTARRYVADAVKRFAASFENNKEELRQLFLERTESILQQAIEDRQKDTALKAVDIAAKLSGMYDKETNVKVDGNNIIKFEFN